MSNTNIDEPVIPKRTEWSPVPKELYSYLHLLTPQVKQTIQKEFSKKQPRGFSQSLEQEKEEIKAAFFHCQVTVPIVFRDVKNEDWILVVQHTNRGFGINTDPIDLVGTSKNVTLLYGGSLVPHGTCVLRVKDPEDIANKAIGAWNLLLYDEAAEEDSERVCDSRDDIKIVYGDIRDAKKYLKECLDEEEREYDYYGLCRRGRYEANSRMAGLKDILALMGDIELKD